jgi:hypothetical protein
MKLLVSSFSIVAVVAALALPVEAHAYGDGTADGAPPAEETVCEDAGLLGAAYGLCVAFCEANDCDLAPDETACQRLRDNYAKITGETTLPCESGGNEDPQ